MLPFTMKKDEYSLRYIILYDSLRQNCFDKSLFMYKTRIADYVHLRSMTRMQQHLSAPLSFIANACNEKYAFYTEKVSY